MRYACRGIDRLTLVCFTILAAFCSALHAEEPNDIFEDATILSPGVLSVSDDLFPSLYPDTILGARDMFGGISEYNDDFEPDCEAPGNGQSSALCGISTNSGEISFAVTGYPDESFVGGHGEFGEYEVFVDAYDFFGDLVDSFSEIRTLQPGQVDFFSFDNFEWIGGTYDAYIDNSLGGDPGDVDFFTFTGLSPGATFTAETVDPNVIEIDTYLGWFDSAGVLIASDDDGAGGVLSLIQGVVPSDGKLTFAVTGYNDNDFVGGHSEDAQYELILTLGAAGDFDGDGDVDGNDFLVWQRNPSMGNLADWQTNYGIGAQVAAISVPEPQGFLPLLLGCFLIFWWR
ncbi:hypothetical protein [Bythopirellula goksoeyrii]|uniref:FG-GAP repeat protein n=1 Tax=Bythopirellula goksoeyrii TaxID=1400387 RepID=A0A5B9Q7T3_9BACT|nr:hypothetical protein [Bythopirellula goksoeyrii]QEG33635.1 hypothetical protein Pr1d_08990 [Bythopirellula goksoeyrii]